MSYMRSKGEPVPTIWPKKYFNRSFLNGKWNHFMDQSHLGYTSWNDPPHNSLRAIDLKEIKIPDSPILGVAIEGSEEVWPGESSELGFSLLSSERFSLYPLVGKSP